MQVQVKSLNKYVPAFVFLVGIGLLSYSMLVFFTYSSPDLLTPVVKPKTIKRADSESASVTDRMLQPAPPELIFHPKGMPKSEPTTPLREDLLREIRKPAKDFLKKVGLDLKIPENLFFHEEKLGPVQILQGSSQRGKTEFYLFSVKGRYPPARATNFIRDYFIQELRPGARIRSENHVSRSSFGKMTLLKGSFSRNEEFQAFFFVDTRSNRSNLLMLVDNQLSRQPARVSALVNSLSRASKK